MIKQVRITNFKSLGDVLVDLEPVTVLIGRSGTGKSNFIDALRFLRDCVNSRNVQVAANNLGGWARVIPATTTGPLSLSYSVRFTTLGLSEDYEYSVAIQHRPHAGQQVDLESERLALGDRVLFHRSSGAWVTSPRVVNAPAANSAGLLLGAVTGVREITRAHLLLGSGIAFYAFPDDVMLRTGASPEQIQTGLARGGENFLQTLVAIDVDPLAWNYQQEMVAALRQLNPSIQSIELTMPGRDKIVVSHEVAGQLLPLELAYESEGLRRLLAHLTALYQTPSKQVLVFEEPERGIHPGALAVLADEFKACPGARRGQVLLTSHSPELLDYFEPEQLRVVEIENHLTRIGPVAPEQVEAIRARLLHPGELLTVDAARLANSEANAY